MKDRLVLITVEGGVADIYYRPEDTDVAIIDFDNLKEAGKADEVDDALKRGDFESAVNITNETMLGEWTIEEVD